MEPHRVGCGRGRARAPRACGQGPGAAAGRPARAGDAVPLRRRGIDQILAHPSDPVLYEGHVHDARGYVALAERAHGPIPRKVAAGYVWGEALKQWQARRPALRIVNLETSITRHDRPWPKGINYRMNPANVGVLTDAGIDCCTLANNHVLDWGYEGLAQTLAVLRAAKIAVCGAGERLAAAQAPSVLSLPGGRRLLVFAAATGDAGVPPDWAAEATRAGVWRLPDLSAATVALVAAEVARHRHTGDLVLFSLHWGGNWGYEIAPAQRAFAHALIDEAGVHLLCGHSSHHPRAAEVHHGHLVLYGCGDFLNDYEGIGGHQAFRSELGLMYFPQLDTSHGRLCELALVPTCVRGFRVGQPAPEDRRWLLDVLRREYARMGCDVAERPDGSWALVW
ncbi:MAG TPA: CapA family protein [Frateuria sp.]|uniref:CapA family protein n=1 Tax=Frateuria sp. TaxID=2211372 RepID=UPI002D8093B8|nr:CapA family protein [Frateuria sp.]HET6807142.1 CapA family protein [Frateuria sp.]